MASGLRFVSAGLFCALLAATGATAHTSSLQAATIRAVSAPASNPYDAQFNQPLNQKWHWVHGKPSSWSLNTARPGYLRIFTQDKEDLGGAHTNAPLLLEKAPTGNYEITTYVQLSPTQDFQQGGIVMYGNDSNFCQERSLTVAAPGPLPVAKGMPVPGPTNG